MLPRTEFPGLVFNLESGRLLILGDHVLGSSNIVLELAKTSKPSDNSVDNGYVLRIGKLMLPIDILPGFFVLYFFAAPTRFSM